MNHCLFISDAAKEVKVESHVLRYWEEELHLPIKRNELGHRYYTEEDVERFKQIKSMKERGLQLKAIKMILKDGKLDVLPSEEMETVVEKQCEEQGAGMAIEIVDEGMKTSVAHRGSVGDATAGSAVAMTLQNTAGATQGTADDKVRRLQWLLQQMMLQTLQENNRELCREIKESVMKELDYQFRMQEERQEAREQRLAERNEEYYKKMDELLRKKSRAGREQKEKGKLLKEKTVKATRAKAAPATDKQVQSVMEEVALGELSSQAISQTSQTVMRSRQQEKPAQAGGELKGQASGIRERNSAALEEAIREKMSVHKKRHFF